MVIGHMHYNVAIEKFIYGFHMPLFFGYQDICIIHQSTMGTM